MPNYMKVFAHFHVLPQRTNQNVTQEDDETMEFLRAFLSDAINCRVDVLRQRIRERAKSELNHVLNVLYHKNLNDKRSSPTIPLTTADSGFQENLKNSKKSVENESPKQLQPSSVDVQMILSERKLVADMTTISRLASYIYPMTNENLPVWDERICKSLLSRIRLEDWWSSSATSLPSLPSTFQWWDRPLWAWTRHEILLAHGALVALEIVDDVQTQLLTTIVPCIGIGLSMSPEYTIGRLPSILQSNGGPNSGTRQQDDVVSDAQTRCNKGQEKAFAISTKMLDQSAFEFGNDPHESLASEILNIKEKKDEIAGMLTKSSKCDEMICVDSDSYDDCSETLNCTSSQANQNLAAVLKKSEHMACAAEANTSQNDGSIRSACNLSRQLSKEEMHHQHRSANEMNDSSSFVEISGRNQKPTVAISDLCSDDEEEDFQCLTSSSRSIIVQASAKSNECSDLHDNCSNKCDHDADTPAKELISRSSDFISIVTPRQTPKSPQIDSDGIDLTVLSQIPLSLRSEARIAVALREHHEPKKRNHSDSKLYRWLSTFEPVSNQPPPPLRSRPAAKRRRGAITDFFNGLPR